MQTLIIEKDADDLASIEMVLKTFGTCQAQRDVKSALTRFRDALNKGQPFNLVTVDIAMPGMQKNEIISSIRGIEEEYRVPAERKACLVVITGQYSRQLVTDCMLNGCNEFIAKPLDKQQLLGILMQFNLVGKPTASESKEPTPSIDGQKLVEYITRKMKRGDLELPPAPRVAMKLRQLVGVGAEIDAIVNVLRQDLSISTKLISISNSVAYGGVTKNTAIGQAVSRLGIDRTLEVVMSICCRGYFVTNHATYKQLVEDLWWHSLACAHATEMIVQDRQLRVQKDLFSLGLLHDVGKLVLIQAAATLYKPKRHQTDINIDALAQAMYDHNERIGVQLLQKWGYDKAFAALIHYQRANREESPVLAAQVLYQADLLAAIAGFGGTTENLAAATEALDQMGFTIAQQADLKERIAVRIDQLRYLFG